MYVHDFIHNVLSDPKTESGLPLPHLNIYVPQDERFGHLKLSDFLAYALKSACNALVPILNALFDKTPTEFDSFQDVLSLYKEGIRLLDFEVIEEIKDRTPFELIKEFATTDGDIFSSCRCHKLSQVYIFHAIKYNCLKSIVP